MAEGGRYRRRAVLGGLGATAALAPLALSRRSRGQAAPSIEQRIWDADQSENGIPAERPGARVDPERGYVLVAETGARAPAHRLFAAVHIPPAKRPTYDLCRRLFDNYRLDQTKAEDNTPSEARETLALLEAISDRAPIATARDHLERQHGQRYSQGQWQELIFAVWFSQFDDGRNRDLSGFEHVMVGEQRGGRVSGYHFWFKYHVDDDPANDGIDFDGSRYDGPSRPSGRLTAIGHEVPEIVTLAHYWHAPDGPGGVRRPLYKPVGSFFVGCSVEGLVALGLVRFFQHGRVTTVINGAHVQLDLHRSPNGRSLRTYFPRLLGRA